MRLIAKAITISHAVFHCNRLTAIQDIQDYASLIFGTHWGDLIKWIRLSSYTKRII